VNHQFIAMNTTPTALIDNGCVLARLKAPEGWSTPRRYAFAGCLVPRASVLECGDHPPLFLGVNQIMPMPTKTTPVETVS